jgi:replicative DNA helicase
MRARGQAGKPIETPAPIVTSTDAFLASGPTAIAKDAPAVPFGSIRKADASKPTTQSPFKGETIKLPMPDPVNEIVVIAAALVDLPARARLVKALPPDSFFAKGHSEIWSVITELDRKALAYDPLTVHQISGGKIDTNYLDSIITQRPEIPTNLDHHIEVMKWDRVRVDVIKGPLSSLVEAIREPRTDPETIKRGADQIVSTLKSSGTHRYLRDSSVLVREQMNSIRARRGGMGVFPFGIDGFDTYGPDEKLEDGTDVSNTWRVIPGAAPTKTTVITGVSGSGKTTVTANIALAQVNAGRRVLYGAWEQGAGMTLEMMAAHSLGISKKRLMTGQIRDDEEVAIEQEMDRIGAYAKFFEVPFGRKQGEKIVNDRALDVIAEYIVASRCEVAIFDLWRRALRQFDPDEEECALYRQQSIAEETKIHQILIHQQRFKDIEAREDKQPTREGLKGSGAWVEVPDTIIGVHRESLFKSVPSDKIRLILLKQRFGIWPLAVDLDFDADTGSMTNGRTANFAVRASEGGAMDQFLDKPIETIRRDQRRGRRS